MSACVSFLVLMQEAIVFPTVAYIDRSHATPREGTLSFKIDLSEGGEESFHRTLSHRLTGMTLMLFHAVFDGNPVRTNHCSISNRMVCVACSSIGVD